jgi:Holliday junction resolvase
MSKTSRNKGKRGERELAHLLNDNGFPAKRGQQFAGGSNSPDVISEDFPFHIECKRVERLDLYGAMTQAIGDAGDKPPCVAHRRNNSEWLFTCRLTDLLELLTNRDQ